MAHYIAVGTDRVRLVPEVPPPVRDTDGWRMWYTRPAEQQLVLYSPIYGTPSQNVRPETCRTTDRVLRAECPVSRDHKPPVPGCACGVYAVPNVVDAIYRVRATAINIRDADPANCWYPFAPDRGMTPVLTRVKLRRAIDDDDVGTWAVLSALKQQIAAPTPVIRAASAEVTRIFVPSALIGSAAADRIAQRLAAGFGVETVGGRYPEYSVAEWDSRPEWMRDEPWRTRYFVDTVLTGFTRDGRQDKRRAKPLHVTFVCTNNIVRSAMAEKMFAHQLAQRGLAGRVRVSSAGTCDDPRWGSTYLGGGIADSAGRLLQSYGYPTEHRAAKVSAEHLAADLVVATDWDHARTLIRQGVPPDRLRLLRQFDPQAAPDHLGLADPDYTWQLDDVYDVINAALPGLHGWVDQRLTASKQ